MAVCDAGFCEENGFQVGGGAAGDEPRFQQRCHSDRDLGGGQAGER